MAAGRPIFYPREQSRIMLQFLKPVPLFREIVGKEGALGARFSLGPLAVESYTCVEEPVLSPWKGIRIVFWETYSIQTKPWRPWKGFSFGKKSAIGNVTDDYLSQWSSSARRWVRRHRSLGRTLTHVPFEEFKEAYEQSGYLDIILRKGFLRVVKEHLKAHPHDVHTILAYDQKTKELLGGVAFVDLPDISTSLYLISFLTPLGKKQAAAYAYIDWWYQLLLKKGIFYADFGIVWQKGDPESWKGYSEFKTRFNPEYKVRQSFYRMTMNVKIEK